MLEIIQQQLVKFGDEFEYYNPRIGMLHPKRDQPQQRFWKAIASLVPKSRIGRCVCIVLHKHACPYNNDHGHMVMMTSIFYYFIHL